MKCIIQCSPYNSNPRNFEPCANLTIQVILSLKHYHRRILQPFRSIEFLERARSNLKKKVQMAARSISAIGTFFNFLIK